MWFEWENKCYLQIKHRSHRIKLFAWLWLLQSTAQIRYVTGTLERQNQSHRLPGRGFPTQLQLSPPLYTQHGTVLISYFPCVNRSVKLDPKLSLVTLRKRLLPDSLLQLSNKGNIQCGPGEHNLAASYTSVCWDSTGMSANRIFGSNPSSGGSKQLKSS